MSSDALAEQIAAFGHATLREGAPSEVRVSVRRRVLDVLGLQLAALGLDSSRAALGFVAAQGGSGRAHIVGDSTPAPVTWAAFANGVLAHSLDFDDTHLPSVLHPSASVIPASMAVAEHVGASGPRLLDAVAVGIETTVRLGMAGYDRTSNDSMYFEHGQHATSICGAVGSAVAAALLLGHDHDGVVDAIGVSASMASGIIEANRTGGTVKRIHCGWAAHAGVCAAQLVDHGITGPPTVLEGRFGMLRAFLHGRAVPDEITDELGTRWEVPGIAFKPYPANHFTHTALDAARELVEAGVRPDDVEEAVLGVATPTVRTIGEPLAAKQRPETGYQGQFSGPYMVALGFLGGGGLGAGLDDFTDELVRAPQRRALMARVRVVGDARCDEIFPFEFPAVLTVRTRSGQEHVARVLTNRGGVASPLSDRELETKFRDNAARACPTGLVEEIQGAVSRLEHTASPAEVMHLVAQDVVSAT